MARAKEFDYERTLEKAQCVFWEKGYEATSIQDLVQATGVNRASLYGTFGGKRELFLLALRRFQCRSDRNAGNVAPDMQPGLHKIRAVFRSAARHTLQDPRGCLLVNSVVELSAHDGDILGLGKSAREHVEAFFAGCLKAARTRGEIGSSRDLRALARFLTNSLFGLRLIAKMQPNRQLVDDIVTTTLAVL